MPFVAECILCRQKVRLPDRSAGASVECPRCHSYFTAAPEHNVAPAAKRPQPTPIPVATAAAVAQPAPPPPAKGSDAPPTALPVPEASAPAPRLLMPLAAPRPRPARHSFDPIGLAAIALCLAALACVWFYALCFLVIPLTVIGVLTGLVALVVGLLADRPRFVVASAGCIANVLVLGIALLAPSRLGPTYLLSRAREQAEVVVPRAVALAGKKVRAGEETAEWPDASRFAVQVKKVRIQVVDATVRQLEIAQTPKKKFTKERYLVLRLRVHQPAGGAEFASDAWGQEGTAQERRQPVVSDDRGNVLKAPATNIGGEAGELTQRSEAFPLGITDEVFVFDAPAPDVQWLHLEMPATAWGGTGTVRFTIPRSMLQFEPLKKGKEK